MLLAGPLPRDRRPESRSRTQPTHLPQGPDGGAGQGQATAGEVFAGLFGRALCWHCGFLGSRVLLLCFFHAFGRPHLQLPFLGRALPALTLPHSGSGQMAGDTIRSAQGDLALYRRQRLPPGPRQGTGLTCAPRSRAALRKSSCGKGRTPDR